MQVPLLLDLGLPLLDLLNVFHLFLLLLLLVNLAELREALHHGVDFLLLVVHEHLFEGPFGGQLERLKQVCLAAGVFGELVIQGLHLLLRLKG